MTEIVVQLLQDGALADAQRLRFLRFGVLQDYLRDAPNAARDFARFWDALTPRTADEIVRSATPFFWKNLHRACLEGVRGLGRLDEAVDHMLRMGLDSFYDLLPDGYFLAVLTGTTSDLVLPRLGVRIRTSDGPLTVTKSSATELRVAGPGREFSIDLRNVPAEYQIHKLAIPGLKGGGAELVMVKDPSMFESDYLDRVAPETPHADYLAKLIGKSLELIAAAMPDLEPRFSGFIRWYFPIDAPDELTHNSLSVKFMSGAIFLSVAYHDFRLAEAMVHELHHNELFLLQESQILFDENPDEQFYSPFRPDARPLNGLFHALFVFTGVANFIACAETLEALADWRKSLFYRRTEVVRQVRLGIAQVPPERLHKLGARILTAIEACIARHEKDVGVLAGALPEPLSRHLGEWKKKHPHLSARVCAPDGVDL